HREGSRGGSMATFKLKAVDQATLTNLISQPQTRAGSSKGAALVEEFKASGNMAAQVTFASTKERNSVSISATNWSRDHGIRVWLRKPGGRLGPDLLPTALARADAATRKAYENRPRPGRKPRVR